ncbi:MAG: TonB-dependent receptor plug domain-containing protein [Ignavibacteriaceae bacterium]|nr:TonB-dependent receptor plug domain-containing protein [Ignavibacteriaceae bacterium]
MLKLLSSFVLFSVFVLPQEMDSLLNQNIQSISDTNFIAVNDTTAISDSLITTKTVKVDTLFPIQGMPLTDVSTIINKRTFLFDQYRYTGDLLRSFSLNFVKDYGFIGYPNETFIYGVGNSGISYLQDGVFWNYRYTNSLDLNLIQSENIDSIEIVPSPRGFLYGPYNNPVTVNFITRDFIPPVPYARIRYYEGPDGEAMIDGKFSAMLAKRWNYSFQLTNRSKDETYKNTELSLWQFNTKLKYFLSNSVNLQAYYYYVDKEQGLNGGVDYDSLSRSSDDPNADLYDPIFAPVLYPNQKLDVLQHNVGLRTLAKPFDNSQLDLSIYYRYGLDELRDEQDSINISRDIEEKASGGQINYYQRISSISFQLLSSYESNSNMDKNLKNQNGFIFYENNENLTLDVFNIGGLFTLYLLDDNFQASAFYRYNSLTTGDYNLGRSGIGIDLNYRLHNKLKFYLGTSSYENYNSQDAGTLEAGAMFYYYNLFIDFKYFDTDYNLYKPEIFYGPVPLEVTQTNKAQGLGLLLKYEFWLFLLETNTSYYFKYSRSIPEWQFIGGLYVNDLFFNENLDLKAGFRFYYTGEFSSGYYTFEGGNIQPAGGVDPTNKLDFNLAGEIQKVAIFYFQWENLFGNEYYITPYYPMPVRNIKFGIAWELFN